MGMVGPEQQTEMQGLDATPAGSLRRPAPALTQLARWPAGSKPP